MKFIFSYVKKYYGAMALIVVLKSGAAFSELLIPYVLEHLIDDVAPRRDLTAVGLCAVIMLFLAVMVRVLNVAANRRTVRVSRDAIYRIRRDLFFHSVNLSGNQIDGFGLPSLTSRMTSDSYNVQNFIRSMLAMGIRAPVLLVGGIMISLRMDAGLASVLCVIAPIVLASVAFVSFKGVPMYEKVQKGLDTVVQVMRENITGIRVVKALSKEDYEIRRFRGANEDLTAKERKAGLVMAMPGPLMGFFLNIGLTLVVVYGAIRVNNGQTRPGVILAFLTYFNIILQGCMGVNRIFMMMSKANASANRIAAVIGQPEELAGTPGDAAAVPQGDGFLRFEHVSFRYGSNARDESGSFDGEEPRMSLTDISFSVPKGGCLGIIGATGSGKTSIINLLMRFYDPTEGHVFVDGRDVRTYDRDELHKMFGVVFQNDVIFADSIRENITFGRDCTEEEIRGAAADACAAEFIEKYEDGYDHMAAIRGSNFSGGQRQRLLISRALAGNPEILVLDDSSSALDYRTDAGVRRAIRENHGNATTIIIAQRISSIMSLDQILVLDEGRIIGHGTHQQLMESCPQYREIYRIQMGEEG